jgi:hypothetical protein
MPGQNPYVSEVDRWISPYIPAVLRAYPFGIGWNEVDEPLLCIDEASGLVNDGDGGELIFTEAGDLSGSVSGIWSMLEERARGNVP